MKKNLLVALIALLFLASCTAGPNASEQVVNPKGEIAGFWPGLWHGVISPFTFIISLFNDKISFYEVHNNGNWYNFGFVLGACIIFGAFGSESRRRK